jgi:hypothetical protein
MQGHQAQGSRDGYLRESEAQAKAGLITALCPAAKRLREGMRYAK